MASTRIIIFYLIFLSSVTTFTSASQCNDKCSILTSDKIGSGDTSLNTGSPLLEHTVQQLQMQERSCYCDTPCLLFKDCCGDSNQTSLAESAFVNVKCAANRNLVLDHELSAVLLTSGVKGFSLVSTCPRTAFEELHNLCKETGFQPVLSHGFLNSEFGIIFANPYCAACNNVQFEPLTVIFSCNSSVQLPNLSAGLTPLPKGCVLFFELSKEQSQKGNGIRYCPLNIIDSCSSSWNEVHLPDGDVAMQEKVRSLRSLIYEKCKTGSYSFRYARLGSMSTYRNQACALCNEVALSMCYTKTDAVKAKFFRFTFPLNSREMSQLTDHHLDKLSDILCKAGYRYNNINTKCESVIANCTILVNLDKRNFRIHDNGSIYLHKTSRLLTKEQYIRHKSDFIICKSSQELKSSIGKFDSWWHDAVGISLQTISSMALLISMISMLIVPVLRQFCVLTMVSMNLGILLLQIMSMVQILVAMDNVAICTMSANLKHYFVIVYPFSQFMLFLELWEKLKEMLANPRPPLLRTSRTKTSKTVGKLTLLWMLPAAIAVMTNVVELVYQKIRAEAAVYFYCKNMVMEISNEIIYLMFCLVPLCIIYTATSVLIIFCIDKLSNPDIRRLEIATISTLVYKGIAIATFSVICTCVRTFHYFVRNNGLQVTIYALDFTESFLLWTLIFLLPLINSVKKSRKRSTHTDIANTSASLCVVKENCYVNNREKHDIENDEMLAGVYAYGPVGGPLLMQRECMLKSFIKE